MVTRKVQDGVEGQDDNLLRGVWQLRKQVIQAPTLQRPLVTTKPSPHGTHALRLPSAEPGTQATQVPLPLRHLAHPRSGQAWQAPLPVTYMPVGAGEPSGRVPGEHTSHFLPFFVH